MDLLTQVMYLGIAVGILSLLAAFYYAKKVEHYQINIPKVQEITAAIREGAMAFLTAEYKILVVPIHSYIYAREAEIANNSNRLLGEKWHILLLFRRKMPEYKLLLIQTFF